MSDSEIRVVHSSWVKLLFVAIEKHGCNANTIYHESGIVPENLKGTHYVDKSKLNALYRTLADMSLLHKLPMMISEVLQVHYFGSIGNAMYNAGSLECYLKVTKFSVSRISPLVKVEFRKSINLISLMLTDSTDRFQLDQFTLESILFTIYQISNQIFPLISGGVVQVNIPKQSGRKNFTQLFLCDISFNEENKYEIAFDNHALSSKNIFSENYGSVDNAQEKLTEVRKYIHENLDNPKISLGFIANLMGVSTKTLQRKLSKNDFTYRTLLLEEQMKAAEKLLVSTDLPIKHVSYEVGYSTPASFCRSFKAFYGVTPSEFRGNLRLL